MVLLLTAKTASSPAALAAAVAETVADLLVLLLAGTRPEPFCVEAASAVAPPTDAGTATDEELVAVAAPMTATPAYTDTQTYMSVRLR